MKIKYNTDTEEKRQTTLETLRHRLKALNNRLSRYLKREKQVQQNKEFIEKPSRLFDQLRIIINFRLIKIKLSTSGDHCLRKKNRTTKKQHDSLNTSTQKTATYTPIRESEIQKATSKFANWKSPGIDRI